MSAESLNLFFDDNNKIFQVSRVSLSFRNIDDDYMA